MAQKPGIIDFLRFHTGIFDKQGKFSIEDFNLGPYPFLKSQFGKTPAFLCQFDGAFFLFDLSQGVLHLDVGLAHIKLDEEFEVLFLVFETAFLGAGFCDIVMASAAREHIPFAHN